MVKYILKRLLMIIPVVIGITFIIFVVLSLSQGDPAVMILGAEADAQALEAKRIELGLNQPIIIQYLNYMGGVIRGDFGTSWLADYDVLSEFLNRIPNNIILTFYAMLFAVGLGIPLGILAATKQYHFVDYATLGLALLLFSLPAFWFGMMGQIFFCLYLEWLPASGVGSLRHFILPSLTLGANLFATQLRMTRTSMLDVIKQDYIRTARAKGAPEGRIIGRHVLRNGLLPVVTQVGISFASCIGGSIVTESVFAIPGIGTLLINAVKVRDIPVVMGSIIFIAIFVGIINLVVDLIYAVIDPRVKLTA